MRADINLIPSISHLPPVGWEEVRSWDWAEISTIVSQVLRFLTVFSKLQV